jgi:hypothetical protein
VHSGGEDRAVILMPNGNVAPTMLDGLQYVCLGTSHKSYSGTEVATQRLLKLAAVPVPAAMGKHLLRKNLSIDEIERLYAAWTEAGLRPYTKEDWR